MAAGGSSSNIQLGAGRLYVAAVGTSEPTSCSSTLPSAWCPIGYTEDGTTVTLETSNEAIEVAEEVDPVLYVLASRSTKLSVQMAELTRRNLALALGSGAGADNDAQSIEPPDPGSEVAVMIVWDSDDTPSATNSRWLFRQCKVNGTIEFSRNKAPNKALLPVEFNCEKPAAAKAFIAFPNSSGLV